VAIALNQLGQLSLAVRDVDQAEQFYGGQLGLRKLFRFGNLLFFDLAGVRLLIEKPENPQVVAGNSTLYFRVADIALVCGELKARGVAFIDEPHLIAPMEDHDLWMAFFTDPEGNTLALMQEAPKGYVP
jgi:methylmalonyl-CoA/ethylmalonyl-CoA epimerase